MISKLSVIITALICIPGSAFLASSTPAGWKLNGDVFSTTTTTTATTTQLYLFDKIFEEEGVLGKGVTVGKISVALRSAERSDSSIFGLLESHASDESDANEDLARMANNVCLDLMRKSDDWVAACSTSKWFSSKDAGKAESYYNDLANSEAVKFEKVGDDNVGYIIIDFC
jgi:hypothetical protein